MTLTTETANLLPSAKGTYAVILHSEESHIVATGKLGQLQLIPGYYVYCGSAFGSGGLRARLKHHLGISSKPHWHLDYLRPHLEIINLWFTLDPKVREHQWSTALASMRNSRLLFPKFGSSDCSCLSHFWFLNKQPNYRTFRSQLNKLANDHKRIFTTE